MTWPILRALLIAASAFVLGVVAALAALVLVASHYWGAMVRYYVELTRGGG